MTAETVNSVFNNELGAIHLGGLAVGIWANETIPGLVNEREASVERVM